MKHTDIRNAVLNALEETINGVTLYDGLPAVVEDGDFPVIAVYLTDAVYTGEEMDADTWQATLHINLFLPAQIPDAELDGWMENHIYPAIENTTALAGLITTMVPQGYDYQRDQEMGSWSAADLTYTITYDM
ncbi:phage minor tail U family protein [Citrobacter sp. Cb027]|uniref:phage minor tail U family protein n=1 Tax=Citrobacter sp. Cb027 TaxID=2985023 RepID=UPI00257A968D|nr:phage minor tail U family protein [Citrobacter sp. Cb027]MDM3447995.1 phage minor tail U family protein [Citrobacter sp. Cb027]